MLLLLSAIQLFGQGKYFTRTGTISFFSETSIENIEAVNNQVSSILDTGTGELAISAQIMGFEFEKALMQEHFNENYMESEKYPKATFKGKIMNYSKLPEMINEERKVQVEGELTIHGITRPVETAGTIRIDGQVIEASAVFPVKLSDYQIKIPKAVIDNIAETVEVKVSLSLDPYNQ
jgi:polyisoprenoid-binding protein YceI